MASYAARNSKTLFLSALSLEWVVLCSWTLSMCMSSISWLWFGSGINISVLVRNYLLISWPRAITMCWTTFYHVVRIPSAELFPLYVIIELTRDLDSTDFYFSLMKVAWFPLTAWIPLTLPEIIHLPEPPPLQEHPLPLPMAVDCCRWYQPYFLLGLRSLNLQCRWSYLLGLGTLRTLWLFDVCPLVYLYL